MNKKLLLIPLSLLLILSLVVIGCPTPEETTTPTQPTETTTPPPTTSATPKELKIGAIFVLSGPFSLSGMLSSDAVMAAADWLNDKGGLTINGEKYLIKLFIEDCKMTPEGSIAAANKLVFDDEVKFIIVTPIPPMMPPIAEVTEPNKVLRVMVSGMATPMEISADTPYSFMCMPTTVEPAYDMGYNYFLEYYPEVETAAMVCPDDPFALYDMDTNIRQAEAHGLTVVANEVYAIDADDFYPMWTKLLATEPDALVSTAGMSVNVGTILKQGRELGFNGPVFAPTAGSIYLVRDIAGEYATDYMAIDYDLNSPEMTPMINEIAQIIQDNYGAELTTYHLDAWNALWCLAQALEEAQSLDPTVVRDSFAKMQSIETPFGSGEMGGLQTIGINHLIIKPLPLLRIMNGQVEHLMWFMPEVP